MSILKKAKDLLNKPNSHENSGKLYVDWPPSLYEIDAAFKNHTVTIEVVYPTEEKHSY